MTARELSPDPIFRRLANTVDVRYAYHGPPGRIAVNAVLSTARGWTSTVPLKVVTRFTGRTYAGSSRLDLSALQARADAAAVATGLPSDQILITVAPIVTATTGGAVFSPTLGLTLDPLVLSLTGGPSSRAVEDSSTTSSRTLALNTLSFMGVQLAVSTARPLSLALVMLSLLVIIIIIARRTNPTSEVEEIRRRFSSLLVRVEPMPTPHGHTVVDVTEPATLAKLAERYGLLILHWTRSNVETFIVQDDATTYRYRASVASPAAQRASGPSR